jgi:hypothetical protein
MPRHSRRRSGLARLRGRTGLLALAALTGLGVVVPAGGPAIAAPDVAPATATEARTSSEALVLARQTHRPVEVLGERTEYTTVFAQPNGTSIMTQTVQPTRVLQGTTWVPVDPTLARQADGSFAARASVADVSISGGGTGPLARVSLDGKFVELGWAGVLPTPSVDGATATYTEVMPGTDLRVTATATGFSEVLVVKTRHAAVNGSLARLNFKLTTKGVAASHSAGGGVDVVDSAGRVLFAAPAPMMWDSGKELQQPTKPGDTSSGRGRRNAVMPVSLSNGDLTVTPDQAMLTDPATVFPVYIDPSFSAYKQSNGWTSVWSKYPTSSFWQNATTSPDGSDSAKGAAKAGRVRDCGTCSDYIVRTLFRMDTAPMRGKHVLSAKFQIKQKWSWVCDPNTSAGSRKENLWLTGAISSSTTWNAQPSWTNLSAATALHAYASSNGCAPPGQVEFTATTAVAQAVAKGWPNLTLGLRAADETSVNYWKRWDENPSIAITYNSYPNQPDRLATDVWGCGTSTNYPWIRTQTPTLKARLTDGGSDGQMLTGDFYWWQHSGGTRSETNKVSQASVSPGATA